MIKTQRKFSIIIIVSTVLVSICLQLYWNIKNYFQNEQNLKNEIQLAFDNSIDRHYMKDLVHNYVSYIGKPAQNHDLFFNEVLKDLESNNDKIKFKKPIELIKRRQIKGIKIYKGKKLFDSIAKFKDIANRIMISMHEDSLDLKKISIYFNAELLKKNIVVNYKISHYKFDELINEFNSSKKDFFTLSTESKSIYIVDNHKIKIYFSNPIASLLLRSSIPILLSLLVIFCIIGSLFHLLKIINKQKKLDEIKNDLISNITHEFKTPITTIATAIEAIKNFNTENDAEKTKRYLNISSNQLQKLETMVERLLETASLDTNQLTINKEKIDLIPIINNCIEKHQLNYLEKSIQLKSNFSKLLITIDSFHFENAISNLIDNAVKYGGNSIIISIQTDKKNTSIYVEDDGIGIDKNTKDKIFEKFYRIPKGNIHDVKGFGIGLYYSKKIIEKHGGTLELVSNNNPTLFKIMLINEN